MDHRGSGSYDGSAVPMTHAMRQMMMNQHSQGVGAGGGGVASSAPSFNAAHTTQHHAQTQHQFYHQQPQAVLPQHRSNAYPQHASPHSQPNAAPSPHAPHGLAHHRSHESPHPQSNAPNNATPFYGPPAHFQPSSKQTAYHSEHLKPASQPVDVAPKLPPGPSHSNSGTVPPAPRSPAPLFVDDNVSPGPHRLNKLEKAQRFRDLTCPRIRTSVLPDQTKIVTVGSHVLVYPGINEQNAGPNNNKQKQTITTFQEHDIKTFQDDSFKHYSLGVALYFKGVRLLSLMFLLLGVISLPSIVLSFLCSPSASSESGIWFEHTTVGNVGSNLKQVQLFYNVYSTQVIYNSTSQRNENTTIATPVSYNSSQLATFVPSETLGSILSPYLNREYLVVIFSGLDSLGCLALLLFGWWLQSRQEEEAKAYSKREITVKKYTIEVTGFPTYYHDRFETALFFQKHFGPVVDVCFVLDDFDILELYRKRGRIRKDIDMAVSHGEEDKLDKLYDHLLECDNEIDDVRRTSRKRKTLCAYITFEHQESRAHAQRSFEAYWLRSLAGKADTIGLKFKGKELTVTQAAEPSNMLFRNLKFTHKQKISRRCCTGLITVILILLSVIAVFFAQYYQSSNPTQQKCQSDITAEQVRADPKLHDCYCFQQGGTKIISGSSEIDCSDYVATYALSRALSLISVFTIIIVNFILKTIIQRLALWEKHSSVTRLQEAITNKLFIGLFLNTGVVLLIVNSDVSYYITNLGFTLALSGRYQDFVWDWFVNVGSAIILTMILNVLNPHIFPLISVPISKCRRKHCLPSRSAPQAAWNKRFTGQPFELAERYAVLLNTIFVTLLYSGGMPILLFFAALAFRLTYSFDRISFLRLYKIPPRFDHELAMYVTTLIPYAVFLHLCFALWFFSSPVITSPVLWGTDSKGNTLNSYQLSTVKDRITDWPTAPTLIFLIILFLYLFLFRFLNRVYYLLSSNNATAPDLNKDASKFIPYSVASRTVTLESYHSYASPYFHDCFIRTPSQKMLNIPLPLDLLFKHEMQKQAHAEALKNQQEQDKETLADALGLDPNRSMIDDQLTQRNMRDKAKEIARRNRELAHASQFGTAAQQAYARKQLEIDNIKTQAILQNMQRPKAPNGAAKNTAQPARAKLPPLQKPPSLTIDVDNGNNGVIVMDLPENETNKMQKELLEEQVHPSVSRNDDDEESSDAHLHYSSHLQVSPHISLPASNTNTSAVAAHSPHGDPLIQHVQKQLHRIATMGTESFTKQRARSTAEKKQPAAANQVADISIMPSSPVGKKKVSAGEILDENVDTDEWALAHPEWSLVPTPCPNAQCNRILELVDVGHPRSYKCKWCGQAFIM